MKYRSIFVAELSPAGLKLHPNSACGLYFYRPRGDGLYQAVVINSSGLIDRKFFAYAVVAFINHGYLFKELCELQVIDDIASDPQRGWTRIRSEKEAATWAGALRRSADKNLKQLEERCLEQLERSSCESRLAAARYLSMNEVPVRHHPESEVVAEMARVCQIPGAKELYVGAIDLILSRSRFVIPPEDFSGLSPVSSIPYLCRIQLIADHLYWSARSGEE